MSPKVGIEGGVRMEKGERRRIAVNLTLGLVEVVQLCVYVDR